MAAEPIQFDDEWSQRRVVIELDAAQFDPKAPAGLDAFSHAEITFLFDRVSTDGIETGAHHPHGRIKIDQN